MRTARAIHATALALAAGLPIFACLACGGGTDDDPGPPVALPQRSADPKDGGLDADGAPATTTTSTAAPTSNDAGPPPRHYTGTLAASKATPFGGPPYCNYTVTLQSISLDLTLAGLERATTGSASEVMVEGGESSCPPFAAKQTQQYIFKQSAALPTGGLELDFDPAPANSPKASLVVQVTQTDAGGYSAFCEFHRTDQAPPLDWRVRVTVPLTAN